MPGQVVVFVNGERVELAPGATVLDAVRVWSAAAANAVEDGSRAITDSRGLPTDAQAPVHGGAIFRVVSGRRHTERSDR